MATLSNHNADIQLENLTHRGGNQYSPNNLMPRLDLCHNCGRVHAMHVEGKCLFESSIFNPRDQDYETFRRDFMSWLQGQKLEDAFCNIVYELTRRDR